MNLDMRAEVLHFHAQGSRARISLSLIGNELTISSGPRGGPSSLLVGPPSFTSSPGGLQGQQEMVEAFSGLNNGGKDLAAKEGTD